MGIFDYESCYIFDWITFSLKTDDVYIITSLLGMAQCDWKEGKGFFGYRCRLYYESISIHYDGSDDMGVCCEMSGQGCRAFETFGNGDYVSLFNFLHNNTGSNISRLDIAFDDHDRILDINKLYKSAQKGYYVSAWQKVTYYGGTDGVTVQHGQRTSDTLLRIYDKAKQLNISDKHWVRCELQLKKDRAKEFINRYLDDPKSIQRTFLGVISNYITYKKRNKNEPRKTRWENAKFWDNFINGAEKISLFKKPQIEYNLAHLQNTVLNYAGAITAYVDIFGEQNLLNEVRDRIEYGRNPKYDRLVDSHWDKKIKEVFGDG